MIIYSALAVIWVLTLATLAYRATAPKQSTATPTYAATPAPLADAAVGSSTLRDVA